MALTMDHVIHLLALCIERERSPVIEWAAHAAFEFIQQERRLLGGVGDRGYSVRDPVSML